MFVCFQMIEERFWLTSFLLLCISFCVWQEPNECVGGEQDRLWELQFWSSTPQFHHWSWKRCGSFECDQALLLHKWQGLLLWRHEARYPCRTPTSPALGLTLERKEQCSQIYLHWPHPICFNCCFRHCCSVRSFSPGLVETSFIDSYSIEYIFLHQIVEGRSSY